MKKFLLVIVMIFSASIFAYSQEVGVRFGNVAAGHVAIDGVFGVSDFSRIHADVSFGDGVGIDVLWDFLYKPVKGEALYWYVGAGPYVQIADPFWLGVAAEIGLEYHFSGAPISLGIDWRPQVSIIENTDFHPDGFGVNVRYVFGKK
jgi:hypothetical protein